MFQALNVKRMQSKSHWAHVALQKAYFAGKFFKTSAGASSFHSCSLFDDVPSEAFKHQCLQEYAVPNYSNFSLVYEKHL